MWQIFFFVMASNTPDLSMTLVLPLRLTNFLNTVVLNLEEVKKRTIRFFFFFNTVFYVHCKNNLKATFSGITIALTHLYLKCVKILNLKYLILNMDGH